MPPLRRQLLKAAAETAFDAAQLEKVFRLGEILEVFAANDLLGVSLVLKGGTALNLCFQSPLRLSADLDFHFIGCLEREEMQEQRPLIEREVQGIGRRLGYGIQLSRETFAGRKVFLSYQRSLDGGADRIEVDLNFLHRQPLLPLEAGSLWLPEGQRPQFPILSFEELAAGKLTALLDRGAARDFWDVAHLAALSKGRWPTGLSRPIFVAYAGTLPHALPTYTRDRFSRLSQSEVTRLLIPMLITGEEVTANELQEEVWKVLSPLLDLDENEISFCEALQQGNLLPELLFPNDPDLARRVEQSPPLRWKAQNARARQGG